ncbi:MAG TPA: formate dehydrogenase, partial [Thermaerobacter sp.]
MAAELQRSTNGASGPAAGPGGGTAPRRRRFDPRHWAGLRPYGLGEQRPNHYKEILKTIWENRDQLGYAWRILRDGCCDGCSLGTTGMRDWTIDGIHLCTIRLKMLRLNTMPAVDPRVLEDPASLRRKTSREL